MTKRFLTFLLDILPGLILLAALALALLLLLPTPRGEPQTDLGSSGGAAVLPGAPDAGLAQSGEHRINPEVAGAEPVPGGESLFGAPPHQAGQEARPDSPPTPVAFPEVAGAARPNQGNGPELAQGPGSPTLIQGGFTRSQPTPSVDAGSCVTPCFVRVPPDTWHRAVATSYGIGDGYLWGHLACGGRLTPTALVVAHRTLPCGTVVSFRFRGHVVTATVRDRGPFVAGRTWDFGPAVARALHFNGLDWVEWRLE